MTHYPYSHKDLIRSPNTYFYSKFEGKRFLEAWLASREKLISTLPAKKDLSSDSAVTGLNRWVEGLEAGGQLKTKPLLDTLLTELSAAGAGVSLQVKRFLDLFLKKFEVSKHVHGAYRLGNPGFRAVNPKDCRDLSLYLKLGELFDLAYSRTNDFRFLNGFLKIMDTLCGMCHELDTGERARLTGLILKERAYILGLAEKKGIRL